MSFYQFKTWINTSRTRRRLAVLVLGPFILPLEVVSAAWEAAVSSVKDSCRRLHTVWNTTWDDENERT